MTTNKYCPHVLVLVEDDANRQNANGFYLEITHTRRLQIMPELGGWSNVIEAFLKDYVKSLGNFPHRRVVLLIDFDGDLDRRRPIMLKIPTEFHNRVFLIGTQSEPEELRREGLGNFENIGKKLAYDCRNDIYETWAHSLLSHNENEILRLRTQIRNILF